MTKQAQAISGTVTGNDQQVGFRAMIMKQAIAYNLAGSAKNLPDDVVSFTLQGDAKRLDQAVAAIEAGARKSSDIQVATEPAAVEPGLDAFTISAWTSTTRHIHQPIRSCLQAAADGGQLSPAQVKAVWQGILKPTLKGDDLEKLDPATDRKRYGANRGSGNDGAHSRRRAASLKRRNETPRACVLWLAGSDSIRKLEQGAAPMASMGSAGGVARGHRRMKSNKR
jgi:acylphosphatase